jgi:16S rRNA (uracil1498-N3)-methyltransferase
MHYFLDPHFNPHHGLLCEEESRHATKSLRLDAGNTIEVGNGKGMRYECRIVALGKKQLTLEVLQQSSIPPPSKMRAIGISPLKNSSRFEWFLEKTTELGLDKIIPLHCSRTERARVNEDRSDRILLAASKQSQRDHLPHLAALTPFAQALLLEADIKIIAHCDAARARRPMQKILQENAGKSVLVLVGPEGDFSQEEVGLAAKAGFAEAALGPNRLRTETAGVYCATLMAALHQIDL